MRYWFELRKVATDPEAPQLVVSPRPASRLRCNYLATFHTQPTLTAELSHKVVSVGAEPLSHSGAHRHYRLSQSPHSKHSSVCLNMNHARIETSAENLRQPQRDANDFEDSEAKKEGAKDAHEHARVCYYPQCAISDMT